MCGRKSNFDPGNYDKCRYSRSLNILHRMSVSIRPIQIVEEDIPMYRIKSFDPRMPSLDMNKIVVSGHIGSSLEFDFTKPLIGVIIWVRLFSIEFFYQFFFHELIFELKIFHLKLSSVVK